MQLLDQWLSELSLSHRILDLGCGNGSLRSQLTGLKVIGVDVDPDALATNKDRASACAESNGLPFASGSFDLVICHHSLEHFRDLAGTISEIRRVLSPQGRLFVSVPEGRSFTDHLYRLLFCGGGHLRRFSFQTAVSTVELGTGLYLAGSQELFSSFIWLDKRRFLGPSGVTLPRRMRLLGRVPYWCFSALRWFVNVGSRFADRWFSTKLARYGWAFAFSPDAPTPIVEPGCLNVCMSCGSGLHRASIQRIGRVLYRCPYCSSLNFFFADVERQCTE
jgi:SAM-dependent methyltransferase